MRKASSKRIVAIEVDRLWTTVERCNQSIERAIIAFSNAQEAATTLRVRRQEAERVSALQDCRALLGVAGDATPSQIRDALTRKLEASRNDVGAILLNGLAAVVLIAASE